MTAQPGQIHGQGDFRYRFVPDWAQLPPEVSFGDVAGVGCDNEAGTLIVFARSNPPVLIFDRSGQLLRSWGEGIFARPHAVSVAPGSEIFLTDDADHTVRKFTPDGRLLMTLGTPGKPAPFTSGQPFCRCTHTAHAPNGDIYVSDGYGNARVHKYSPDGRHLLSWGDYGTGPGQFNLPHNIVCDAEGWVYVADRENHRLQVFDANGRFEAVWSNLHRPNGLAHCADPGCSFCVVSEGGPDKDVQRGYPNLGPRVSVVDMQGRLLSRFGELGDGSGDGGFIAPHGVAVDAQGNIYVGEVAAHMWPRYHDRPPPPRLTRLHKYERIL